MKAGKSIIKKIFERFNIITKEENEKNFDIDVLDDSFYSDLINYKTLGLGEAYMNEKFKTNNLENLLIKLAKLNDLSIFSLLSYLTIFEWFYFIPYIVWKIWNKMKFIFFNQQTIEKSKVVGEEHYDLPNVLYDNMLGATKLYSCAYWQFSQYTLDDAQKRKAKLIMDKLYIEDGQDILEIGSGWGYIASQIAVSYPNCKVIGVTISAEQIEYCLNTYKHIQNLTFHLIDYRFIAKNSYDRIYSVGFAEHIGFKNYEQFYDLTYNALKDTGLMLVHTICRNKENYGNDPFIDKYIFRGAELTSASQILKVVESSKFHTEDMHEFGLYYAETLKAWKNNFYDSYNKLQKYNPEIFDEKFQRMWLFYLTISRIGFLNKTLRLTQFIFSKNNNQVYNRYF
jgi:cyclopropane-fatty-acyl-phospholipid synthase